MLCSRSTQGTCRWWGTPKHSSRTLLLHFQQGQKDQHTVCVLPLAVKRNFPVLPVPRYPCLQVKLLGSCSRSRAEPHVCDLGLLL